MADKKQRRPLRLILLSALAGAIVLAILYLRCGPGGFGIGGGKGNSVGKGDDSKKGLSASAADAGVAARPACKVRLDATGITLAGKATTLADAVQSCKQAGSADLTVTGDAAFGKRKELRDGLHEVGIPVLEH
ncbi:MAG TPA: hypothetical protein VL172_17520 [Kofleriaceae bacterium]|jgi:hypothetical protein|nr:hypothetical protein [Kofleriaceae bacterium]